MKQKVSRFFVALIIIMFAKAAFPCTTFVLSDGANHYVYGRNYDFLFGGGHICINKRNVTKKSLTEKDVKQLQWTSKFGSVTFNQAGQEFPIGGINEKGLVIDIMWFDSTKYPEADDRFALSELQWIQYQLDNAESVNDVIASDSLLRIESIIAPIHFLICDKNGNSAVIEFLKGKMVSYVNNAMPYKVLANDSYENSVVYANYFCKKNSTHNIPFTVNSLDRFARAAKMCKNYSNQQNIIDYSFEILSAVSQVNFTQWSIVYDVSQMKVYFKTIANPTRRSFEIKDIDFSCTTPMVFANINDNTQHEKLVLHSFKYATNRQLIEDLCDNVFLLNSIPKEKREALARYPESISCNNK